MLFAKSTGAAINTFAKRFRIRRPNAYYKTWPNDWVPFVWSRPEKVPGYFDSGDLRPLQDPSKEDIHPDYSQSEHLKSLDADHPLRKLFSVDHVRRSEQSKIFSRRFIDKMGIVHHVDFSNSLEAKIVSLTYSIRHAQETIRLVGTNSNWNGKSRLIANSLTNRRYRYLCELKELHKGRYDRIIKSLEIEPKENKINVPHYRPYRKIQMRLLAKNYSADLKEKKVDEFLRTLEEEQAKFEKYKSETLKWIEEKETELGLKV